MTILVCRLWFCCWFMVFAVAIYLLRMVVAFSLRIAVLWCLVNSVGVIYFYLCL